MFAIELILLGSFVAGITLVIRGWYGTPEFSEPHCRKCDFDVRAVGWSSQKVVCPECGSDLTQPKAVRFGGYRKRPKLIWSGTGLRVLPLTLACLVVLQYVLDFRWQDLQPNAWIIANLSGTGDTLDNWKRLEGRYKQGRLSDAEVTAAIDELIALVEQTPGQSRPIGWSDFYRLADAGGHIREDQLMRLAKAYYGSEPNVLMRDRLHRGQSVEVRISSKVGSTLPGKKQVLAMRAVKMDGRTFSPTPFIHSELGMDAFSASHDGIIFQYRSPGEPGEHELTMLWDWGLLVSSAPSPPNLQGRPGQKRHWPKPIITRSFEMKRKIYVVPEDEDVVRLVIDPARDPSSCISTPVIRVFPHGEKLLLKTEIMTVYVNIALGMNVQLKLGDTWQEHGKLFRDIKSTSVSMISRPLDHLSPEIREAALRLVPDQDVAANNTYANEIWGKPIVFEGVPLERFDVEDEQHMKPLSEAGVLNTD